MSGVDLLNNLIDELNRASGLLKLQLQDNEEITDVEQLLEDIRLDLDRYYDVADSINACIEDIVV